MSQIDIAISSFEQQRLLRELCRHPAGYLPNCFPPFDWQHPTQTIPERITALALVQPNHLAVRDHAVSLTYAGLDQAANAVARAILELRGAGQEAVALLVGVDAPAVCAALGVLKAGKIYVALEETFPLERQHQIIADAGANLIVADNLGFEI